MKPVVGDRVRLRPRAAKALPGHVVRGGEAVVLALGEDAQGTWYQLRTLRNDHVRFARREDLIIHRKRG